MSQVSKAVKLFQTTRETMVAYRLANEALNAHVVELNDGDYKKYQAITSGPSEPPVAVGEA